MNSFSHITRAAIRISLAAFAMLLAGCSSTYLQTKLTDQTVADMSFFADETIALLGGGDPGLRRNQTVLLREYLTGVEPDEILGKDIEVAAHRLLAAMAEYSIDIALLYETADEEQRRLGYIQSLTTFEQEGTEILGLQALDLAANVRDAAAQETLLESMQAGQRVIDAIVGHSLQILSVHDDAIDDLARTIAQNIEADYAGLYEYRRWLNGHRDAVLLQMGELIAAEAAGEDIVSQEEALILQLQRIHALQTDMQAHWQKYEATHHELDRIHLAVLGASNRTRLVLLIWSRAHERMTSGRVQEAEWFTMQELGAFALKYGISLL